MTRYDVVGIGNAIVDVLANADDSFLDLMGIQKGIMQLVERNRGELLYGAMRDPVQAPGGSVAGRNGGIGWAFRLSCPAPNPHRRGGGAAERTGLESVCRV